MNVARRMALALTCVAMILTIATPGCAADYVWRLPPWIKPPPVPADNPMSAQKVELGRRLFYDIRLSGPGYMACATCHEIKRAFTDGRKVALGATGERHHLNVPQLANVGYQRALTTANPTVHRLEQQALLPLFGEKPIEMDSFGFEQQIINHLATNSVYTRLFRQAFPKTDGQIDFATITKALAAFQRTLVSANAPYDRYRYAGDATALSPSAKRGEALFYGQRLGCGECHSGPHLTDAIPTPHYHNTGLRNDDGKGGIRTGSRGLIEHTGKPADMGRFKTPSLRNVALTAPYMHDGSLPTLDKVIDHYAAGGRAAQQGRRSPLTSPKVKGFAISPDERADLIAFLESLTDETFIRNQRLATPFR